MFFFSISFFLNLFEFDPFWLVIPLWGDGMSCGLGHSRGHGTALSLPRDDREKEKQTDGELPKHKTSVYSNTLSIPKMCVILQL